jgi:hypothetical protein
LSRFCVQIGWDDVPHLSTAQKAELLDAFPPHERNARAKGVPMLGSGRIYPVDEAQLICEPFQVPSYWPRAYGFDPGWKITAAIWGAWDRDSDIAYLISEHYMGQQPPQVHAEAIKRRGEWIAGASDPSAHGVINHKDGTNLLQEYRDLGLSLVEADNTVEAGIMACYRRMASGRLKVFSTLPNWLREYRIYRRDEKGKVVKENDHAMDAMRYLIMTGMQHAATPPMDEEDDPFRAMRGRSKDTGY